MRFYYIYTGFFAINEKQKKPPMSNETQRAQIAPVELIRELRSCVMARGPLWSVAVGVLFFIGGFLAGHSGMGWGVMVSLLVALFYGTVGLLLGYMLGVVVGAFGALPRLERELHQWLEPTIGNIVRTLPFGQEGLSLDNFRRLLEGKVAEYLRESRPGRSFVAQFLLGKFLSAVRIVLIRRLARDMRERNEAVVSMQSIERTARETLVGLALAHVSRQLQVARFGLIAVGGSFWLIPALGLLIF